MRPQAFFVWLWVEGWCEVYLRHTCICWIGGGVLRQLPRRHPLPAPDNSPCDKQPPRLLCSFHFILLFYGFLHPANHFVRKSVPTFRRRVAIRYRFATLVATRYRFDKTVDDGWRIGTDSPTLREVIPKSARVIWPIFVSRTPSKSAILQLIPSF